MSVVRSLSGCVITTLLLTAACTGDELAPGGKISEVLEGVEDPGLYDVEADTAAVVEPFDLYSQEHVPVFQITLEPAAETRLREQPREYVPALLQLVDGDDSETLLVGVRLKGNGSYRSLDGKAALRIKIDKYKKTQRLRGLTDLTLNNMIQDQSLMAERLAYHVFRELGVAASRANHAQVYVNDVYYGVYANIETPKEDFLARWFDDPTRNLYEQNRLDFHLPDSIGSFELETNDKQPDDRAQLRALHEACAAFDLARARELVDWPQFLLYSAIEAAVNQVDGYSYAQSGPNNFRIYDSENGIVFIPWGLDWALGGVATQDDGKFLDPLWVRPTHGVLMRMCLADEACTEEYKDVVRGVAERWDDLELERLLDTWSAQIDEAFQADERREASIERALDRREERREQIVGRAEALRSAVEPR